MTVLRRCSIWFVFLCLVLSAGLMARAATPTTYTTESSFFAATGLTAPTETFDGFDNGTCVDHSDTFCGIIPVWGCGGISGAEFWSSCSNATTSMYSRIRTPASSLAVTAPNELSGGYLASDGVPVSMQVVVISFDYPYTLAAAAGFYLTGLFPTSVGTLVEPASVFVTFDDDSAQTFYVGDSDGDEATAEYFGLTVSDTRIVQITITSGWIISGEGTDPDVFGVDNLSFTASLPDTLPPLCERYFVAGGPTTTEYGRASDDRLYDTGLYSIDLLPGATNITLSLDPDFFPGTSSTVFRIDQTDTSLPAAGVVLVTDGADNTCTLRLDFRIVPPGPLDDFVLCQGDGILFQVSNESDGPGGVSACSANLYTPEEPALPPGYTPSPDTDPFPCRVLTIDSPISGQTDMVYKKDGVFDSRLRLMFSRSTDGGLTFPPFTDVTESVQEIANIDPDPTRLSGRVLWSPVKVACALLDGVDCATFIDPDPDVDEDSFALCSAGVRSDCNDRRSFIHPGAAELCNGMDDDCDSTIDENNPQGGGECTVPGQQGACAEGEEQCINAALLCTQTTSPETEVCNGFDDDCDGSTDENHIFGGYLPPVNADGSSIFKWKRTIPFKFQLTDCWGAFVSTDHPTISVFFYSSGVVGTEVEDVGSSGAANTDRFYRYDPTANQYIYNFDTRTLSPRNSYLVRTTLDDGSTHDVVISIR